MNISVVLIFFVVFNLTRFFERKKKKSTIHVIPSNAEITKYHFEIKFFFFFLNIRNRFISTP